MDNDDLREIGILDCLFGPADPPLSFIERLKLVVLRIMLFRLDWLEWRLKRAEEPTLAARARVVRNLARQISEKVPGLDYFPEILAEFQDCSCCEEPCVLIVHPI